MKVRYRVHRVSPGSAIVEVDLVAQGQVKAQVPSIDVEMVPVSHPACGTVKLEFIGADAEAAKAKFAAGMEFELDWAAALSVGG